VKTEVEAASEMSCFVKDETMDKGQEQEEEED
jgi:hypothetical protein